MTQDQKGQIARTVLSVLGKPDAGVLEDVVTSDVVWSFPGTSPISGEAHGVLDIIRRARIIAEHGVKVAIGHATFGPTGGVAMMLQIQARKAAGSWTSTSVRCSPSKTAETAGSTPTFPTWPWPRLSSPERANPGFPDRIYDWNGGALLVTSPAGPPAARIAARWRVSFIRVFPPGAATQCSCRQRVSDVAIGIAAPTGFRWAR
jgi:hypothetical protein